jgi:hypothetical protein
VPTRMVTRQCTRPLSLIWPNAIRSMRLAIRPLLQIGHMTGPSLAVIATPRHRPKARESARNFREQV